MAITGWREFPAFVGLAALSVDAAIRRYAAGMVLRRRASREGHRSPNQAGQASTGDGTGDRLNSISAPVTWATVRGECARQHPRKREVMRSLVPPTRAVGRC